MVLGYLSNVYHIQWSRTARLSPRCVLCNLAYFSAIGLFCDYIVYSLDHSVRWTLQTPPFFLYPHQSNKCAVECGGYLALHNTIYTVDCVNQRAFSASSPSLWSWDIPYMLSLTYVLYNYIVLAWASPGVTKQSLNCLFSGTRPSQPTQHAHSSNYVEKKGVVHCMYYYHMP